MQEVNYIIAADCHLVAQTMCFRARRCLFGVGR